MSSQPAWSDPGEPVESLVQVREPLTARQRWFAALAAVTPIVVVAAALSPLAIVGTYGASDVLAAALVYGGLLGLAAGFVYVDRVHAWQCPRCGGHGPRGARECARCGYDLEHRPRFACDERHAVYLDPGRCGCGRRLQRLPTVRGIGHEVAVSLKFGAGLLVFLLLVGTLLRVVGA